MTRALALAFLLAQCPTVDPCTLAPCYVQPPQITGLHLTSPAVTLYNVNVWGVLSSQTEGPASMLPSRRLGETFCFYMRAGGGSPPYTFAAANLPPGLDLNATTGAISGAPTEPGRYAIDFSVTDAAGQADHVTRVLNVCDLAGPCNLAEPETTRPAAPGALGARVL